MAKFSVEVRRRDFLWIVPVLVLVCVGFGYSYGGSEPDVMGHSAGELEIDGVSIKQYIDDMDTFLLEEIQRVGGGSSGAISLVNGDHDVDDCSLAGGEPAYTEDSDGVFCKFSGDDCSAVGDGSWSQFKYWKSFEGGDAKQVTNGFGLTWVGVPDNWACGYYVTPPANSWNSETHWISCSASSGGGGNSFKDQNIARRCTFTRGGDTNTMYCKIASVGCY